MRPLTTTEIRPGVLYTCHPDHRNGTLGKSQWRVVPDEEIRCFARCLRDTWTRGAVGWSLHLVDGRPEYLGVAQDHRTPLFVAKFVDGTQRGIWHGYPADHQRNHADIPDLPILRDWLNGALLTRPKIRKLIRGQPCSL